MADLVTERIEIAAPPDRCWEVILDYEAYPRWARDIKEVRVLERDDEGRGLDVTYRAAGFGRSANYCLRYDYSLAPQRLSWVLVEGDVIGKLDGYYQFDGLDLDRGSTDVTYRLEVDLVAPLPGFVKRRTQFKIMATALKELKARVEAGGS